MIKLTEQPIQAEQAIDAVAHCNAGANLLFLGTTRQWTGEQETRELKYECYQEMALKQMQQLHDQAMEKWPLLGVCIIHRLGSVPVGQTSIAVAVSSGHRQPAFEAGPWLIDRLKQVVPVWKQEINQQGDSTWVHPLNPGATS